jgi:hypothetical protein
MVAGPPSPVGRRRRLRKQLIRELGIDPVDLRAIDRDRRRRTWKVLVAFAIFNALFASIATVILAANIQRMPSITAFGPFVRAFSRVAIIGGMCFVYFRLLAFPLLNRLTYRPLLAALRERGYNLCPKCGYHWDGLPGSIIHCPECGEIAEIIPPQQ